MITREMMAEIFGGKVISCGKCGAIFEKSSDFLVARTFKGNKKAKSLKIS